MASPSHSSTPCSLQQCGPNIALQRTSLRAQKGEEKTQLSGSRNPTSWLFHLPYKAKARSFPLPLGPLKAARRAPGLSAGCGADGDGGTVGRWNPTHVDPALPEEH